MFTSVIILLGEFFKKKNAPKPRHESTIRFFLHDTSCPRQDIYESSSPTVLGSFFKPYISIA
ncbi:Hypothetical protein SPCCCB_spr1213 [Streptococcus pneumoniae CCCB]|uniref:Uncharacterized protein n=2 Tax=Streptococcus pneumoniae TaxID=1313 RepID=Q8CYN2_STRR6|nr:Hypothetical protein spr1213 [Streptococcus pneumoniae R6]OCQ88517.1 hypothetical protein A4258_04270 [Streptococcus pneumoniae]OLV91775.1 Hypothetical protein SPCCCB_spr1213 [Streptococcus pneumoniae CCCB]ODO38328.1 hypothetical protein A5M99_10380 [Streptococcus pneumoniae]QBK28900.1 hypothetical protein EZ481_09985 [Streptococcus pneumoniae]